MVNEKTQSGAASRRALMGTVSSVGGDKTIRVVVSNLVKHPVYGKYVGRRTKLAVHDPANDARLGDVVEITQCRRISKTKSWRLARIVRRGDELAGEPAAKD